MSPNLYYFILCQLFHTHTSFNDFSIEAGILLWGNGVLYQYILTRITLTLHFQSGTITLLPHDGSYSLTTPASSISQVMGNLSSSKVLKKTKSYLRSSGPVL